MKKIIMFWLIIALLISTITCGIAVSSLSSDLQTVWNSSGYQEWEIMDNLELAGEAFISPTAPKPRPSAFRRREGKNPS